MPARESALATSCSPSRPAAALDAMDAEALGDDLVDRLARVQRSRRVLEYHLHPTAVARRSFPRARLEQDLASSPDQAHDGPGGGLLPHPDSPASARTSPLWSSRRTPSTARAAVPSCREAGDEADATCEGDERSRTSRTSRRSAAPGRRAPPAHASPSPTVAIAPIDEQARGPASLPGWNRRGSNRRSTPRTLGGIGEERAPGGNGTRVGGSPPRPEGAIGPTVADAAGTPLDRALV